LTLKPEVPSIVILWVDAAIIIIIMLMHMGLRSAVIYEEWQ
jgi:hypothetical protein